MNVIKQLSTITINKLILLLKKSCMKLETSLTSGEELDIDGKDYLSSHKFLHVIKM